MTVHGAGAVKRRRNPSLAATLQARRAAKGGGVMADRRVLVTGGTGFVGRQVVAALAALGAEALVPARPGTDLLARDGPAALIAATRPDTLVHAAWVTRHGAFWDAPENLDWIAASLGLVRRFVAAGGKRLLLVGSCAEYDWSRPTRTPWRETRATRPGSLYGAAKLATWTAAAAFAAQSGVSATAARLFVPVGRGEAAGRLLPSLIAAMRAGEDIRIGPAELTRCFIDVRDAGEAIARLALSDAHGPVNIGGGRPVALGELARKVAGASSHLVHLGGRPPRPGEPLWMVADAARLRRATGFVPRYALEDTIADAMADP
jgi:nucleoside-diphosphate-sugar epimerase